MKAATMERARRVEVCTTSGATACVEGESIVVRDDRREIVAVYDARTRTTRIVAPDGDLVLAAPKGRVVIESTVAVETSAPNVEVRAGRWAVHAERVFEHAVDAYREISGLAQLRAHRARTLVQDAWRLLAGRTSIVSEEDTAIDGKRVLLG
jgi:hypothetical protein